MAKQTWNSKGYDYEMPKALAFSLVHRKTWRLWCREGCGRDVYPNVIDVLDRLGEDANGSMIERRGKCRHCGGRLKVIGGMHLSQLIAHGDYQPLVVADGSSWYRPAFLMPTAAVPSPFAR